MSIEKYHESHHVTVLDMYVVKTTRVKLLASSLIQRNETNQLRSVQETKISIRCILFATVAFLSVVLLIMLCKMVLKFVSVGDILKCDLHESY